MISGIPPQMIHFHHVHRKLLENEDELATPAPSQCSILSKDKIANESKLLISTHTSPYHDNPPGCTVSTSAIQTTAKSKKYHNYWHEKEHDLTSLCHTRAPDQKSAQIWRSQNHSLNPTQTIERDMQQTHNKHLQSLHEHKCDKTIERDNTEADSKIERDKTDADATMWHWFGCETNNSQPHYHAISPLFKTWISSTMWLGNQNNSVQ